MGDHKDGLAHAVDSREEAQQLVGGAGIQGAGGLVGQDDLRGSDQGAGDGSALLLAAGDLVGILLQQAFNAQGHRDGHQGGVHFAVALTGQDQGQADIVLEGEGIQQVELLEHKTQVVPAEGSDLAFLNLREILSVQQHGAGGGLVQGGEDVQQRGFSGSALAHDGDVLAFLDGEIHVLQRFHGLAAKAGFVDLFQVFDF